MTRPSEENRSTDPADAATQRRKERGVGAEGVGERDSLDCSEPLPESSETDAPRHREEVAGRGSGGTAGGPPATAAGEDTAAKRSLNLDPAIEFDPARLGGGLSNTPPSIPKHNTHLHTNPHLSSGGEDTLELSLYLRHSNYKHLTEILDKAREAAESGARGADELTIDGFRMLCGPGSAGTGKGSKGARFRWRLQSESDLTLNLMRREAPHESLANGQARFGSLPLLRLGTHGCWQELQIWLDVLGIVLERAKVSRVDPCVDLADWPIDVFAKPFQRQHYVSAARSAATFSEPIVVSEYTSSRKISGFRIGGANLQLRVYNKLLEVRRSPAKLVLLAQRRWGYIPEDAIRVEFQIRREALKRFGIDTYEDWLAKRAAVVDRVSFDWLRFTDGPVDRKHQDRCPILPDWAEARRAFADWAGDVVNVELLPVPRSEANVQHLIQQLYGLTVSVLLRSGRRPQNANEFTHEAMYLLLQLAEDRDVVADCQRKLLELGLGEGCGRSIQSGQEPTSIAADNGGEHPLPKLRLNLPAA